MSNSSEQPPAKNPLRGFFLLRGLIIPIPRDRKFIIGRDKNSCDIALPDQRVSKQHFIISCRDQKYIISDMGSMNGTYLNGEKVKDSFTLMPGDEVKVTPFSMLFIGPDQEKIQSTPDINEHSNFSGQLQTLKVVDLVQLINSTGQSGALKIKDIRNKPADMIFVRGEIVAASYGNNQGEEAVYSILGLADGEFDFLRGEQTMPTEPITKKTQALLFEGCQLKDENRTPSSLDEQRTPSRKSTQPLSLPVDLP